MSILFLDIDGVLHDPRHAQIGYFEGHTIVTGENLFCHAPLLASLLQQANRTIDVVISSTWQRHFRLEEIKDRLGGVAPFVTGATLDVRGEVCANRFEECQAYAHAHDTDDWRMLDDDPSVVWGRHRPPLTAEVDRVILCDPVLCLPSVSDSLRTWLTDT
jgi:hypothetical protein